MWRKRRAWTYNKPDTAANKNMRFLAFTFYETLWMYSSKVRLQRNIRRVNVDLETSIVYQTWETSFCLRLLLSPNTYHQLKVFSDSYLTKIAVVFTGNSEQMSQNDKEHLSPVQ